jgi:hypothetical protein
MLHGYYAPSFYTIIIRLANIIYKSHLQTKAPNLQPQVHLAAVFKIAFAKHLRRNECRNVPRTVDQYNSDNPIACVLYFMTSSKWFDRGGRDIMAELSKEVPKDIHLSQAAVDGLFAGLLAGLAMAVFLAVTALVRSEPLSALFSRFNPAQAASPLTGLLLHLAVSSVYGILFGLVWYITSSLRRLAPLAWQAIGLGGVYGVVLFFMAWYVLLPASASPLRQLPIWQFGAAHLVYGLILGWRYGRN